MINDYIFYKTRQYGAFRRQELFEMMPKLAEIYQSSATAHMVFEVLLRTNNNDPYPLLNLIEQITLQNIDLNKKLIKAIEQGFNPRQK